MHTVVTVNGMVANSERGFPIFRDEIIKVSWLKRTRNASHQSHKRFSKHGFANTAFHKNGFSKETVVQKQFSNNGSPITIIN